MNAIRRVEVLRDGAGALYGSDAIAGVINLVLDDSLGFESNIAYGQHRTDLKPIGDDINDGETFTLDARYGWQVADDGFFKAGAAYRNRNGTNRAGFDQVPFFIDQTPANLALAGQRNYAEGDPEVEELNLWFNGEVPVGELGVENSLNASLGPTSPTSFESGTYTVQQTTLGVDATRDFRVSWLPAPLAVALGAEYRAEDYTMDRGDLASYIDGSYGNAGCADLDNPSDPDDIEFFCAIGAQAAPGLTPDDEASIDRGVFSIYAGLGSELTERLFSDPLVDYIQALPGGEDIESVRFFTNAVDTRTRGFDAVLSYVAPLLNGDLQVSAAYNYSKTDVQTVRGTTPELEAIDPTLTLVGVEELNTLEDAAPHSKFILSSNWSGDQSDFLGRVSRYDSAVRVFNFGGGFEPRQKYGAEIQVDVEAGYRFSEQLAFYVGAANLLDEYPDLSSPDINYFGNLPYDILSPVGVNGRYLYARASMKW